MRKRKKKRSMAALVFIFSFITLSVPFCSQDSKGTTPLEVPVEDNPNDLYNNSYALLIGIWEYTKGWEQLSPENIENDLETVAEALKMHGFKTEILINPTYKEITDELERFKNSYGLERDNRLLFYFSGHGWSWHNNESGYIVPKDAPFPDPNTWKNKKEFLKRAVSMEDFITLAKEIESRHVLFLFDSCFSGAIFRASRGGARREHLEQKELPVRLCITAGMATQRVPGKSVFTPAFVRGIEGNADLTGDGLITGGELFEYIKTEVEKSRPDQNPQKGTIKVPGYDDEGEFIFTLNKPRTAHNTSKIGEPAGKPRFFRLFGNQKQPSHVKLEIRVNPYADVYLNGKKLGETPPRQIIEKVPENTNHTIRLDYDQEKYYGKFVIKNGRVHWIKKIDEITVTLRVEK